MTDAERVEFLQGQMQAVIACLFALIEREDAAKLYTFLEQNLEGCLAKVSGEPVPEALVDGIHDMKDRLLRYAATAMERQAELGRS